MSAHNKQSSASAYSADRPVFVISVAAELAGMHPQTLRQYDRLGLVQPSRAPGKARRYSQRDVDLLQRIQQLSQEGVSLEGIRRIIELEEMVEEHRDHIARLQAQLEDAHAKLGLAERVFAFSPLALMRPPVESIVIPVRPDPAMPSSSVVIGLYLLIAKTLLPHGMRNGTATANVYDGQPPLTAIP